MEVYLKDEESDVFRFPVVPPTINIQDYAIMNDSNITAVGDIVVFGGKGLRTTELSSFFPNPERKYSFVNYSDYPAQYECVSKIKNWMDEGKKLRFIVTDTEINFLVKITNFEYSEQNGTRDVYYTLSLKEYREVTIPGLDNNDKEVKTPEDNKNRKDTPKKRSEAIEKIKNNNKKVETPTNKNIKKIETPYQTIYKVKKEDETLYDIAKKYYGKGSDYTKIQKANAAKYPSLKKNTKLKVGWELIIP